MTEMKGQVKWEKIVSTAFKTSVGLGNLLDSTFESRQLARNGVVTPVSLLENFLILSK